MKIAKYGTAIVGADLISDRGYMGAKVAQEKSIQSAAIPYTIVRATQFFELIKTIIAQFPTDGQTVRLPSVFIQPILSEDVADALVNITLGAPVNGIIDLADPERFRFKEIILQFPIATQDTRQVVVDSHVRYFGAVLNDRLIPQSNSLIGSTRFEDWLNHFIA